MLEGFLPGAQASLRAGRQKRRARWKRALPGDGTSAFSACRRWDFLVAPRPRREFPCPPRLRGERRM